MTKEEKAHQDRVASLGCIACALDGMVVPRVSIHHCNGRVKPGAHMQVLPLCYLHHQSGSQSAPSIHPWKRRFIAKYGTQESLMARVDVALSGGDWMDLTPK